MRVLVTNDDGIQAPGIEALSAGLVAEGHEVTVVAPLTDTSGSGTGTGPQRREHVNRFACVEREVGGAAGFGLDGLPSLCVTAACSGAFGKPPELVVSGVNAGRNIGRSVLHSGTVGAALTAVQLGRPAIAASVQARAGAVATYASAVWLSCRLIELAMSLDGTALNCNVPDVGLDRLAGIRLATVGDADIVRSAEVVDGFLEMHFLRAAESAAPGSDELLGEQGYATVTPIVGVCLAGGISRAALAGELLAIEQELGSGGTVPGRR